MILFITLTSMFPEGSFDIAFQPLSYKTLIHEVLVREAALLLIQQDLGFDRVKALKTLTNSEGFGTMLHPGDNSPHIQAVIDKTTKAAQHQKTLFRMWKASNSVESFSDWLREQNFQDDDPRIKVPQIKVEVKEEGKEINLRAEGSSSDGGMEVMGFRTITDGTHTVYELMD
jgi:RTC4-like domain